MISLPGVFFLSASGTRIFLTRLEISPVSRLASHQVVGRGVVASPLPSNVYPPLAFCFYPMIFTISIRSQVSPESINTQSGRRPDST